ncbi:MAG TPA: hypothetical protein VFQ53_33110 [Kofleriaceae bacterium]|nr:hypothetical protein [Kofleriaceae bacterium]
MKLGVAVIVLALLGVPAHADPGTAKVFPLSGANLPKSMAGAPAVLTKVLAKTFGAEVANVPIEDAAGLMECELAAKSCLISIAKSVEAKVIVYGRVEPRDGGLVLKLSSFDVKNGANERTFVLKGETTSELSEELAAAIENASKPKPPDVEPGPDERPKDKDKPKETPIDVPIGDETESTSGPISTSTWAIIGGGGAVTAVGAGLLLSTISLRNQVDKAPRDTFEDLLRLRELENAGKTRTTVGGIMLVAGGAITTYGIIRAISQRHEKRPPAKTIDVVPEAGGASVILTVGWP